MGAAGRSSIEALGCCVCLKRLPGDHYRGPALALGAGGYGMSVLSLFSCGWRGLRYRPRSRPRGLAADAEALPDRTVSGDVLLGQVLQQPAAPADEQQQPAAAVVVVLVHLQVLGQVVDPPGQQRNLDFRRTGVTLTGRVLRQDLLLDGGVERHVAPSECRFGRGFIPRETAA